MKLVFRSYMRSKIMETREFSCSAGTKIRIPAPRDCRRRFQHHHHHHRALVFMQSACMCRLALVICIMAYILCNKWELTVICPGIFALAQRKKHTWIYVCIYEYTRFVDVPVGWSRMRFLVSYVSVYSVYIFWWYAAAVQCGTGSRFRESMYIQRSPPLVLCLLYRERFRCSYVIIFYIFFTLASSHSRDVFHESHESCIYFRN